MAWNPRKYAKFANQRLRPALDLLGRIPATQASSSVVDLGCGSGAAIEALVDRFPSAKLSLVDSSPEMLRQAADVADALKVPVVETVEADFETWRPHDPVDVLFSNAALHWAPRTHKTLLPRLLGCVRPGGWLGVQMPFTRDQPSHRLMLECARAVTGQPEWQVETAQVRLTPQAYRRLLAAAGATDIDIWTTEYLQEMTGRSPVSAFTASTGLRPFIAALGGEGSPAANAFLELYRAKTDEAYPPEEDGTTLFPFRRVFLVARRKSE